MLTSLPKSENSKLNRTRDIQRETYKNKQILQWPFWTSQRTGNHAVVMHCDVTVHFAIWREV